MNKQVEIITNTISKYYNKIKNTIKKIWTKKIPIVEKSTDLRQTEFTPEEFKELDKAAFALSRRFRLSLLRKASELGSNDVGKLGQEVHGWMEIIFGNRYAWLHDNGVFDRAISYALRYYNPEIFSVIKDYDFPKCKVNVMILPEKEYFEKYPEFEFDKVIILTQGKTFEESVMWIDNCVRFENGYKITKTVAPCNFLNLGFTLWDKPVLVLKDAVGMEKLFYEAKTTAKQMEDIQDQILKIHIYTKRQEEKTMKEKLLEKDIEIDQIGKRFQYFKDSVKAGDTRNPEEKLKQHGEKYNKETYKKHINWKKIGTVIATVVIVGLILFFISRFT